VIDLSLFRGMEDISRLAASSAVSGLWQGVVLAAGVGICLRLVPKTTAAIRFAVWTAGFVVLALLPLVHWYGLRASGVAGHGAVLHVDVRWSFAIAAIWAAVSLVRVVRLIVSAVQLRGIWKRAVLIEVGVGRDTALAAAGVRGVSVCLSEDVDRPSVIGFFSPRILIPREIFERLTAAELEQIVLHEVGHLRRADDWMNLLQKISLVLVPLNPAMMWIERRLCFERELACDDVVLRMTKAPKAYATCLTNLAEQRLGRRALSLSLGAWEQRSELARRVHSILRRSEKMGRVQARLVLGMLVVGLICGAGELSRCPQIVSFSRGAAPLHAEAQSLPSAEYQAVAFPSAAGFRPSEASHETLLKASMPVASAKRNVSSAIKVPAKRPRPTHAPVLIRTRQIATRQTRQWVVLTSWEVTANPRMVLAVSGDREFSSSFAAVPTEGGWLVFQL
jgi:hypothetical protein